MKILIMDMGNNVADLYFKSRKISLLILAVTAIISSRMLLFFVRDLEGPNLIIVAGLAMGVYFVSAAAYVFGLKKMRGLKRLSMAICIQVLAVTGLYFCMKWF